MLSSPSNSSDSLGLLLADIGYRPILEKGLSKESAGIPQTRENVPRAVDSLLRDAPDADMNDLARLRWGIIVPKSAKGQLALEAISTLRAWRETEQGAPAKVFYVDTPNMDAQAALDWRDKHLRVDQNQLEEDLPRYLLILGDLDEVSAELGHVLANGSIVGRLHFDQIEGYTDYADKVIAWEKKARQYEKASVRFFAARDGSSATMQGEDFVIAPCLEMARRKTAYPYPADVSDSDMDIRKATKFIASCQTEQPTILLSVCHGAGQSAQQMFASLEEQHALQGALMLDLYGGDNALVTAEKVRKVPFLPGGMWFSLSCFGAGTPATSAFHPWLARLYELGDYREPAGRVLSSLPKDREKPFLAALPKALLANPNGPLAMIGHLDLAWTYGFVDPLRATSRAARIFSSVRVMANGSRVGVAHDTLMRSYRDANDALVAGYHAEEAARVASRDYRVNPAQRAHTFMLRNDLRGYVLLGDPAARMPIAKNAPSTAPSKSADDASTIAMQRVLEMEKAVLQILARRYEVNLTEKEIAKKYLVSPTELNIWVAAYLDGGRGALRKLG